MKLVNGKEATYKHAAPAFRTLFTENDFERFTSDLIDSDFTYITNSANLNDIIEDLTYYGIAQADAVRASFARYGVALEIILFNGIYYGYYGQY